MEKVDIVLVGAEGVVESGGIINKVCFDFGLSTFRNRVHKVKRHRNFQNVKLHKLSNSYFFYQEIVVIMYKTLLKL